MPKTQLVLRSILIFSLVVLVLGLPASGDMPLSETNNSKVLFSGQIPGVTLNLKPEPPGINVQG